MKPIFIKGGYIALVDDEDYDFVMQWKWTAIKAPYTIYAVRSVKTDGKRGVISMHRTIMNTPKELVVDHKDGFGLNNQKSNLRNCTRSQNGRNRMPFSNEYYVGVYRISQNPDKYVASVGKKHVGTFLTATDAAMARDKMAIEIYGEFAKLNFK